MKFNRTAYGRSMGIVFTLSATLAAGLPLRAEGDRDSLLVGKWEVSTRANSAEKRLITLHQQNGQLGGFYTRKNGRKEPITMAQYANKRLSFQVPTVRLRFRNVKFVSTHLEGEVIDANPGKMHGIPQAVKLVRVPN
jgi:hypothetical protein